jgi:hypothetical protein
VRGEVDRPYVFEAATAHRGEADRKEPMMKTLVRTTIATFSLCLIAACASLPEYQAPPTREALEPDPASRLGRLASEFADRHGPGVSGFAAIDANGDALQLRLAVIDSAERSRARRASPISTPTRTSRCGSSTPGSTGASAGPSSP